MKTAVEWLESEILEHYSPLDNKLLYEAIHKAKEMEKERIVEAVYHTCSAMSHSDIPCGEQYYNKTFNYEPNKCYHPLTERKHTSDTHFECTICGYNNY